MLIKLQIFFLCSAIFLFTFVSLADVVKSEKKTPSPPKSKEAIYQEQISKLMRTDPRVANVNVGRIQRYLDVMKNDYALQKYSRNLQDYKPVSQSSSLGLKMTAQLYKTAISHPDLEEASGNKLAWYNSVGSAFVALYSSLNALERAALVYDSKAYSSAVATYIGKAKELETVLAKPEKISAKEMEKLKEVNTQRRKREIQKKINELTQKRRTGQ